MSQDVRSEIIGKSLRIKPISHGQIHTFQVFTPESRIENLSLEKRQVLEKLTLTHQGNLNSLIVRRTNAYDDEDIEYELIHGSDWLQVAEDLNIEKVWAWVFDMTDEEAMATIEDMKILAGQHATMPLDHDDQDIAALLDKKLESITASIKKTISSTVNEVKDELHKEIGILRGEVQDVLKQKDEIPEKPESSVGAEKLTLETLENLNLKELQKIARDQKLRGRSGLNKAELRELIRKNNIGCET